VESICYYETEIGHIGVIDNGKAVTRLLWDKETPSYECCEQETELTKAAAQELREYLAGKRKQFTIPLKPIGTIFRKKVWDTLLAIPYGSTMSYMQVAFAVGSPKACRAVGGANHNNPIPIFIPCHRVIGADGSLTGFGGGMDLKKKLLALESKNMYDISVTK
jgi:methylated-DNA-[protein]-cysteine S-methyltransferase